MRIFFLIAVATFALVFVLTFSILNLGVSATEKINLPQGFDKGLAAYDRGNFATAVDEWWPLANQGDAQAQFKLGLMYKHGLGVERDYGEAAVWFQLAAEQGDIAAMSNLGSLYENGLGVPQNYSDAATWFQSAAEKGEAGAQSSLSIFYSKGQGVVRDNIEAYKWASLAVGGGAARASEQIQKLYTVMTAAQIAEAQVRARKWISEYDRDVQISVNEPSDQRSEPPIQLAPGDRLTITVLDEPGLSGEFEIDASGKIIFPLIGEFDAGKLTAQALASSLTEKLLDGYLKNPNVSAEIVQD